MEWIESVPLETVCTVILTACAMLGYLSLKKGLNNILASNLDQVNAASTAHSISAGVAFLILLLALSIILAPAF